jgi:hypothetical protein
MLEIQFHQCLAGNGSKANEDKERRKILSDYATAEKKEIKKYDEDRNKTNAPKYVK